MKATQSIEETPSEGQVPGLLPAGTELSAPNPLDSKEASSTKEKKKRKRRPFKIKVKFPVVGELTWSQIWKFCVEWISNPANAAAFFWCILATAAFVVVVAVELHLLDEAIPDEEVRHQWKEVGTQILNALFVLMCLVWHPVFMRDILLLIRWTPKDKKEIRAEYCKGGTRKPRDRLHMSIVVFWLQLTCWATYAFAAVFWVYPLGERPFWLFLSTCIISFVAPAFAFLHLILSPLGKDYDIVKDGKDGKRVRLLEKTPSFAQKQEPLPMAEWNGHVCPDCCSNRRIACLTTACCFCMYGYNMERLGFGHRVTHTAMFVIVMIAPIVVFEFSAAQIHDHQTRTMVEALGVLLAILGLAYGGLWRIKMRETFNLPGSKRCCWNARLTDICAWMFCPLCALCQEVRTTDQYQVAEGSYSLPADVEAGIPNPGLASIIEEAEEDDELAGDDEDQESNLGSPQSNIGSPRSVGSPTVVQTKPPKAQEM